MIAMTVLTIPVMVMMLFVGEMLEGIEQSPELSRLAGSFCKQLVWGLPPYYWFQAESCTPHRTVPHRHA